MDNKLNLKTNLDKSEQVDMDLTEPVEGSHVPNTPMEKMDDNSVLGDLCPESTGLYIPTDEEDALLDSTPNTQPSTSADTVATEHQTKSVNDRPRLCGAARKRLRLYIEQGMDIEEARIMCLKPMKEVRNELRDLKIPRKRGRSDGSTPEKPNPPKRVASATADGINITKGTNTIKSTLPSYSDVTQIVRLGVIPSDFPNTIWSDDKLKLIQAAVLDKIVELKKGSIKPQFSGCTFKPGWLVFNCKGNDSAKWIMEHVPTLKPWQDAAIKVVSEDEVPKTEKFVGYFPEAPETPNSRILSLIEGQNDDLTVEFWKVLNRVSKGSIAEITFAIDPKSASKLKEMEFHIGYGYGTVHIRPTNRQQGANDLPTRAKVSSRPGQVVSSKEDSKCSTLQTDLPSCSGTSTKPVTQKDDVPNSTGAVRQDRLDNTVHKRSSVEPTSSKKGSNSSAKQPNSAKKKSSHGNRPRKGFSASAEEAALRSTNRGRKMAARSRKH